MKLKHNNMSVKKPLIVIVGPTASGKTALALDIAAKYSGEIICADSRTLYIGMDIGTAKPTAIERRLVPHHLLDILEPGERLGAAEFKRLAEIAIEDIRCREKVPILVGGSGLYIDSVIYNFQFPPSPEPAQREYLNGLSLTELLHELKKVAPMLMSDIDLRNRRRIIRAIETAGVGRQRLHHLPNDTLVIGLAMSKEVARQRITCRVKNMLEGGFIEEVKRIGLRYGWDSEAMNIIGYRACRQTALGLEPLEVGEAKFIAGDLALYKKQMTWFKRNKDILWVNSPADANKLVGDFLDV